VHHPILRGERIEGGSGAAAAGEGKGRDLAVLALEGSAPASRLTAPEWKIWTGDRGVRRVKLPKKATQAARAGSGVGDD